MPPIDDPEPRGRRWSRLGLAGLLLGAGTMHFVTPEFFDDLVPGWVPGPERMWTSVSGVAELVAGALVARRRTERIGAWAALAVFVAVYPANIHDTITHPPTDGRGIASLVRLPLQLPLFVWALRHTRSPGAPRQATATERPSAAQ